MKTFKFALVLRTHESTDVFITLDDNIYGIHRKRVNILYIFHFLWDHWAHYGTFDKRVLLMYTLEGVSSVANFITAYEESQ